MPRTVRYTCQPMMRVDATRNMIKTGAWIVQDCFIAQCAWQYVDILQERRLPQKALGQVDTEGTRAVFYSESVTQNCALSCGWLDTRPGPAQRGSLYVGVERDRHSFGTEVELTFGELQLVWEAPCCTLYKSPNRFASLLLQV